MSNPVLELYEGGAASRPRHMCTRCNENSIYTCSRCGDYYCSSECQRLDWQRHRHICAPMPSLVPASVFNMRMQYENLLAEPVIDDVPLDSSSPKTPETPEAPAAIVATSDDDTSPQALESQMSSVSLSSNKSDSSGTVSPPILLPQTQTRVLLASFSSPNRCYVRPLSVPNSDANLKKIDASGKISPPLKALPNPHTYAITQSKGVWCRVEVLAVHNEENIHVLFCDYGTIAVRKLCDLRMISKDMLRIQQHAVSVQLRNVENYVNNDRIMSFLSQFVDREYQIRFEEAYDSCANVELYDLKSKKCLNDEINRFCRDMAFYVDPYRPDPLSSNKKEDTDNEMLAALKPLTRTKNSKMAEAKLQTAAKKDALVNIGSDTAESVVGAVGGAMPKRASKAIPKARELAVSSSMPVKGKSAVEPVLLAPFEIFMFKLNWSNFKAVVLDNSGLNYGYVGCIAESDLVHLIQVQEYLSKFKDTNQPYRPQLHEYCLARFESGWYRARVVGIPNATHYDVVYLDFTNENTLTSEDIRRYPSDLKGDCRTNLCLLDGLPTTLNAEHIKFLKNEIITQSKITIDKVKEFVQQITVIECRSIIEKMRNQGLI